MAQYIQQMAKPVTAFLKWPRIGNNDWCYVVEKNKWLRIRNNDLGSGKILIKCIEWLTDEHKWLNRMFFFLQSEEITAAFYGYAAEQDIHKTCWETKWSVPWFDCDESLTWWGLNLNPGHFGYFTFILCFVWRITFACLVVCRWQVRPSAEDQGWSHRLGTRWPGDQEVVWRYVRSAPCTQRREAQVSWLRLKITGTVFSSLTSKPVPQVSRFWPQSRYLRFGDLDLKITTAVFWFGP
jgi:hypothetical protein